MLLHLFPQRLRRKQNGICAVTQQPAEKSLADTHTHADIHEKDLDYLRLCRRTGLEAAAYYGWTVIHCERNGEMRPIEDIHEEIYRLVQSCLNEQERSNVG